MFSKPGWKSYLGNVCMSIFVDVDVHISVCTFIHVCTYTSVLINLCVRVYLHYIFQFR